MASLPEFKSPYLKIARARRHRAELEAVVDHYFESALPWQTEVKQYPDGHAEFWVSLNKPYDHNIDLIAADVINNLRAALDQAVCSSIRSLGTEKTPGTYFPFGKNEAQFTEQLNDKARLAKPEVREFIRALAPYPEGNRTLWSLNRLWNEDKHNSLVPGTVLGRSHDESNLVEMTWDSTTSTAYYVLKNVPFFTGELPAARITLAYAHEDEVSGLPLAALLDELTGICEGIVMGIEAETARLLAARG